MPIFGKEKKFMSRIGNRKLVIPTGVEVTIDNNHVTVKGPKGELNNSFDHRLKIEVEDGKVVVKRKNDTQEMVSLHGTTNALIKNMLVGVHEGYKVELETVSVGYRFSVSGNQITVNAGYSNPVIVTVPKDLQAESKSNNEGER